MLSAVAVLATAMLLGAALAALYLRGGTEPAVPLLFGALHGLIGIGGLGCLVAALRGPPRGLDQGTASFGSIAATLLALAAFAGLGVMLISHAKKRRVGTLIGLHATLAISGFAVLAAYLFA